MKQIRIEQLLDVGIALSKEKDGERLQELILNAAMEITNCDGGTLYILNGEFLEFKLMITKSLGILRGGRYGNIDLPPVPLSRYNACALAAMEGDIFNVPDGYNSERFDFSGPRQYDAITGYRTMSMLVAPMEDDKGRVIGVLQLLNSMDENNVFVPFDRACEPVIMSLASQAAIALTNRNYAASVQTFMDSFVRVMSTAIDARTPYNANHTRGMALIGERFIDWLNAKNGDWVFTPDQKRMFLMSVWLHDIGKLTIPLEIMDKASRLGPQQDIVFYRFQVIGLLDRVACLDGRISEQEYRERKAASESALDLIRRANRAYALSPEEMLELQSLGARTYQDVDGEVRPWLTQEELKTLCIERGTLTPEERTIMESHVVMTSRMLGEMKFPPEYSCVPMWAGMHHEFLNGKGYPDHLSGDQIPREARLLTILDIFDALTQDRPYSPPQPVEKAMRVLDDMVQCGQLDGDILALFQESRIWEEAT